MICTGVSANWCPIHGDCTCADPDDKNDDDCPLHSGSSTHGEKQGVQTAWGFVLFTDIEDRDDWNESMTRAFPV